MLLTRPPLAAFFHGFLSSPVVVVHSGKPALWNLSRAVSTPRLGTGAGSIQTCCAQRLAHRSLYRFYSWDLR